MKIPVSKPFMEILDSKWDTEGKEYWVDKVTTERFDSK
jgi:hypothetical protein